MAATESTSPREAASAASDAPSTPTTAPLIELNGRSAYIALWDVFVFHAEVVEYQYRWNNEDKRNSAFRCLLVSADDPSLYCLADRRMQRGTKAQLESAQNRFKEGLCFRMSKVAEIEIKQELINAPKVYLARRVLCHDAGIAYRLPRSSLERRRHIWAYLY